MPRPRASSRAKASAKAAAEQIEEPQQVEGDEDEFMDQDEREDDGGDGGARPGEETEEVMVEADAEIEEAEEGDGAIDTPMDNPGLSVKDLPPLPEVPSGTVTDLLGVPPLRALRKDRTLQEFLGMMDEYGPIIPDAVAEYFLSTAGFECKDVRIKRLLALAAQKFVADIATDAYQYSRVRNGGSAGGSGGSGPSARRAGAKAVLTMEDLRGAMGEIGGELRRPDFYR